MLHVVIDGERCDAEDGSSILGALRIRGIRVPTLCHDDRLAPTGACRSCLVRIKGQPRLAPACSTPLVDGMVIETATTELEEHRWALLTLLARRYPAEVISAFPEKEFHHALREYGVPGVATADPDGGRVDRSHACIAVDMSRCIDCYRCVRICNEVQGQRVWHVRNRGLETRIEADGGPLGESGCVGCGACVDTCPTGALEDAGRSVLAAATHWIRTTCPYCGVGCEMDVGTRDDTILSIRPTLDAPVNRGHLCVKGHYAFGFVRAPDRITTPMIREAGGWRTTTWSEARAVVASRLRNLIDRHGPDSIGILGSARATNEDNYVAQKFARIVVGTHNVDCCARVCHAPSAEGLKSMLGAGLGTNSFEDIEVARTILVCGANATEAHPVVGARIRQAARRGANLIVIDPRRIELTADAACHLALKPGTNVALLNALAHVVIAENLCDAGFLNDRVDGFEEFTRHVLHWTPERAARICGVDADAIRFAARLYAANKPAMTFHGLGVTEHVQGTDGVMALINLALLTGNLGNRGGGINPLRGQNNVQGAAHMGCDPRVLPGSTPIERGRDVFEQMWSAPLSRNPGLTVLEMMDAATAGRLNGLWTIGWDILLTNANANDTARALKMLDLVIVQDLFLNETAREFGTVFLPACSSFEKDGTFMNAERRVQRVRAALRPLGESKPDWQIVSDIARAMGSTAFRFHNPEEIWDEVRALCGGAQGMTYARLDNHGLQWPCPSEGHPGTPVLHVNSFVSRQRATLRCLDYTPTPEHTSGRYPLLLITGRSLYQFNAGTMTGRSVNQALRPDDLLEISPHDAVSLGIEDGQRVRIESRYGAAVLPAKISDVVANGQVFATFHTTHAFLNAVTSRHRDHSTGTPEYKVTAVHLERMNFR